MHVQHQASALLTNLIHADDRMKPLPKSAANTVRMTASDYRALASVDLRASVFHHKSIFNRPGLNDCSGSNLCGWPRAGKGFFSHGGSVALRSCVRPADAAEAAGPPVATMTFSSRIAAAYGGRQELTDAVQAFLRDQEQRGKVLAEVTRLVTPEAISRYLYAPDLADPDLIIRTSGEIRLSGFLLWQSAYSEFYFTDVFWPAFRKFDFLRAVREFQKRRRRFRTVAFCSRRQTYAYTSRSIRPDSPRCLRPNGPRRGGKGTLPCLLRVIHADFAMSGTGWP